MAKQTVRQCPECGCGLSRYNTESLCAGCARSQGATERECPAVPDRVWQDPEVREALSAWDFGQVSRLLRQRSSLRQDDMAQLTGLSQAFLSMLESGARRLTNIDKIIEFLTGLGTPAELVPLPLPRKSARPAGREPSNPFIGELDPSLPWTASRMVAALNNAAGGGSEVPPVCGRC
ncbi:helix-turn-helix transcriptional regulator [Streptomyces sp. 21So2-11]|uniref:helix-turn-helix domain-containing protein n=1 Tax=Streptomyces sp. 21So2-11 TaxID=3144408 RepID=UPI00321C15A3